MELSSIILIIKCAALILAVSMFIFKYRNVQRFKSRHKHVGSKWLLWYGSIEILGTASPSRRDFMQTHNKLSTIMWICILIAVALFLVPV